jgi:hypothetical protein
MTAFHKEEWSAGLNGSGGPLLCSLTLSHLDAINFDAHQDWPLRRTSENIRCTRRRTLGPEIKEHAARRLVARTGIVHAKATPRYLSFQSLTLRARVQPVIQPLTALAHLLPLVHPSHFVRLPPRPCGLVWAPGWPNAPPGWRGRTLRRGRYCALATAHHMYHESGRLKSCCLCWNTQA